MKIPPGEIKREKFIHKAFVWGVWLKAFDGCVEILSGIALLFTGVFAGVLAGLSEILTREDFIKGLHGFISVNLQHAPPLLLAKSGRLAAAYLFGHGVVKIILAVGLLRGKLWAYPSALTVFTLFIAYQLYRYLFTHSVFLLILSALDLVVIGLTWHEYRYFKKYHLFAG